MTERDHIASACDLLRAIPNSRRITATFIREMLMGTAIVERTLIEDKFPMSASALDAIDDQLAAMRRRIADLRRQIPPDESEAA